MMILKVYSHGNSLSARKRNYQKLRLHQKHPQRELTQKRMKIQQHVHDTLMNTDVQFSLWEDYGECTKAYQHLKAFIDDKDFDMSAVAKRKFLKRSHE